MDVFTAELAGLKAPSWHELHFLQLTLTAGLGHFGILPHWPSFIFWARPASFPVELLAHQEAKGRSCKEFQGLDFEAGTISLFPFLLVKASHEVILIQGAMAIDDGAPMNKIHR